MTLEQEKQAIRERFAKPTINDDYVVNITPDKDIITAVDKDETELHRLSFVVDGKKVYFKSPRNCNIRSYKAKFAELLMSLARFAPNLEIPEDKIAFIENPYSQSLTHKLLSISVGATKKIQNLILEIFFDYLDGHVEGVELSEHAIKYRFWLRTDNQKYKYLCKKQAKHQKEWFNLHARLDDIIRIFTACFCVDDFYKKKSDWILKNKFHLQTSQVLPFESTSVNKPASKSKTGNSTQPSSFAL